MKPRCGLLRYAWLVRIALLVGAVGIAGCFTPTRRAGLAYVDEFDLSASSCGFGKKVAKLEGQRGFYAHPESAVVFRTNGKVASFDASVGIVKGSKSAHKSYRQPAARFRIWADDKVVHASGIRKEGQEPIAIHADLKGAKTIILETQSAGAWTDFTAADCQWLAARFTCEEGATLESETDEAVFAQLGRLTPQAKDEPQFNGADIWGVRPCHPIIFRVAVSGVKPMTFTAKGLPAGVTLDAKGVLRGIAPKAKGDYDIEVTAENAAGRATKTIRLAVGDAIALTPPMGWNSWNVWCFGLTAERAKASARAMEMSGLGDYGWSYVNLDDWWEMNNTGVGRVKLRMQDLGLDAPDCTGSARDADGRINPNRSFPDMKELTDYIHSFGFKAGLYSSPGPLTCGGCEGSYQHELLDAQSYAEWGFDFLKYDGCTYDRPYFHQRGYKMTDKDRRAHRNGEKMDHPESFPPDALWREPYKIMGDALAKQPRDIFYSIGQGGDGGVEYWGREVGGHSMRTWDDLKDTWPWMEQAIAGLDAKFWKHCGKGYWMDPDMLIVGRQRSFGYDHPTFLTPNEQYTHVSVWAMLAAPLLIGCDLAELDDFTFALLANREIIALSQDRAGNVARRVRHNDAESIWLKTLANGDVALALVNRSPIRRTITVDLKSLGFVGEYKVRDCWRQADEPPVADAYAAVVPAHATQVIRCTGRSPSVPALP